MLQMLLIQSGSEFGRDGRESVHAIVKRTHQGRADGAGDFVVLSAILTSLATLEREGKKKRQRSKDLIKHVISSSKK